MHKVLIISGTPIISGAEYVLGDFLKNTRYKKQIQIFHSDIKEVNNFYKNFDVDKIYKSKYLKPVGAVNNKLNIIKKIYNLLMSFVVFFKIFKNNKDIKVVLGNNTGDVVYAFYSYMFGKKHINYIHDMMEKNSFIAKSILAFDKFIDQYIVVSKAVKNSLIEIGIDENKINVIYNGLTYNKNYDIKLIKNKIVFGWVGNIESRKNPYEFIEFMIKAKDVLSLEIEGRMVFGNILDKKLFNEIQYLIKKYNLSIKLLGKLERNDMRLFYKNIHYLVLTSKKDPLPTVILEAFNNGVPVIAHNVDGIPEMVKDGYNGFLYNSPDEFEKILKILLTYDYNELQKNANLTIKKSFNNITKVSTLEYILLCIGNGINENRFNL